MSTETQVRTKAYGQFDTRMLNSGLDFNDYFKLQERCIKGGEDWVNVCQELGDRHVAHAQNELEKGHKETAKYFFFAAECLFRVGQYSLIEITEERLRIYQKSVDAFRAFAQLYGPTMEEVAVPYNGKMMDGWLFRAKEGLNSGPLVVNIPGATGYKEEFFLYAQKMVERGLSVLLIDGPGQGTSMLFNKLWLQVNVEDAYKKMVDFVQQDGRKFGPIGIIGHSTGGYYVSRWAATDDRIAACVWNSGSYYPQEITDLAPGDTHRWAIFHNVSDEEMMEIWPQCTLEGLAERITCPYLVMHSDADPVFSLKGAQRAYDEAKSTDKELKNYSGTWHVQAGEENEAYRYMADWLADRLKGGK